MSPADLFMATSGKKKRKPAQRAKPAGAVSDQAPPKKQVCARAADVKGVGGWERGRRKDQADAPGKRSKRTTLVKAVQRAAPVAAAAAVAEEAEKSSSDEETEGQAPGDGPDVVPAGDVESSGGESAGDSESGTDEGENAGESVGEGEGSDEEEGEECSDEEGAGEDEEEEDIES